MNRSILRLACLFGLVLGLSACGSNQSGASALQFLRTLPSAIGMNKETPPRLTQEQIGQALASTDQPLILVEIEETQSQSLLIQIERNRAYATFATPTRQSIILRDGLITATRGLGGDLMSSDVDSLLRALRGGHSGQVPYVLRILTPEDVTKAFNLTCKITRSPQSAQAECAGDGVSFTNSYNIGAYGQITSSRQWIGPTLGYIRLSILRG